jgi:hypothetical protein
VNIGVLTPYGFRVRHGSHHHHVAIKELGHLLTHFGFTHPEVFSVVFLVHFAFWGVVFISLDNLLRGIRFTYCIVVLYFVQNWGYI